MRGSTICNQNSIGSCLLRECRVGGCVLHGMSRRYGSGEPDCCNLPGVSRLTGFPRTGGTQARSGMRVQRRRWHWWSRGCEEEAMGDPRPAYQVVSDTA